MSHAMHHLHRHRVHHQQHGGSHRHTAARRQRQAFFYWISRASAIHQYARIGCERARFFGMVTVIYKYQRHMPLAKELESWHVMMLACNGRTTTNAYALMYCS
jgi:hypothetical protein